MRKRFILLMPYGFLLGCLLALFAFTAAPASAQAPGMGGEQTCLKCHGGDPKVQAILESPMGRKGDARTPMAQLGCQSCHGLSDDHIAGRKPSPDIVFEGPHASPVKARNEVCLGCHMGGERMNWEGSAHEENGKACTDCHTSHSRKDPVLEKTTQAERCFTCHTRERSASFLYSHHPVREGLVTCSGCHNPHGGANEDNLKEFTVNETCYNCHADKRGPMLWEHQPVRENCLTCHTPHGSNQPRLIKEELSFLCSSCHSSPANHSGGTFAGGQGFPFRNNRSQLQFTFNSAANTQRQCLNCHSQIHGSNSPAGAYFFR